MAIPQLSPEERQAALEKAKAARIKRAEGRDDLKSGKLTREKVLDMKEDPIVGRMKVSTLIETLPGYGKAKAEKMQKILTPEQFEQWKQMQGPKPGMGHGPQMKDGKGCACKEGRKCDKPRPAKGRK